MSHFPAEVVLILASREESIDAKIYYYNCAQLFDYCPVAQQVERRNSYGWRWTLPQNEPPNKDRCLQLEKKKKKINTRSSEKYNRNLDSGAHDMIFLGMNFFQHIFFPTNLCVSECLCCCCCYYYSQYMVLGFLEKIVSHVSIRIG